MRKITMYDDKFVKTLPNKFDIEKLKIAYDQILNIEPMDNDYNQLCLTHRIDSQDTWHDGSGGYYAYKPNSDDTLNYSTRVLYEKDFTEFNVKAKHTYFYEVYEELSKDFVLGRVRLMAFPFKGALSWHQDYELRIHVPIISTTGAFMTFEDLDNMIRDDVPTYYSYHFPPTGEAFIINPTGYHTAYNGYKQTRVNLLLDIVEIKNKELILPKGHSKGIVDPDK